jgi:RNA polymerase sigma-70 factor (ECF subfamily)
LPGNEGAEHAVERRLNSQVLVNALGKLGDEQRDVLVLRFVSGLTIAQAAQALHKTEDSVKALQRRGLSALRELLKSWEEEDV